MARQEKRGKRMDLQKVEKEITCIVRFDLVWERVMSDGDVIENVDDAMSLIAKYMVEFPNEVGCVLYLDQELTPMCFVIVGRGSRADCLFDFRQVMQAGITCGAKFYVLIHNHPCFHHQKDIFASDDDKDLVEFFSKISAKFGLYCYDSFIVSIIRSDQRMLPAYKSMKTDKLLMLTKDYADYHLKFYNSDHAKERVENKKYISFLRINAKWQMDLFSYGAIRIPHNVRDLLEPAVTSQPCDFVGVLFLNALGMPLCMALMPGTDEEHAEFDPVLLAKMGLMCDANMYILIHQYTDRDAYRRFASSDRRKEIVEKTARVTAEQGIIFFDSIVMNFGIKTYFKLITDSLMLSKRRFILRCNGMDNKEGIVRFKELSEGKINWCTDEIVEKVKAGEAEGPKWDPRIQIANNLSEFQCIISKYPKFRIKV